MSESIKLSLGFACLNFEFELEDGTTTYAVLREMNGSSRNRYMEWAEGLVRRDDNGKVVGMKGFKDSQTFVLSLCLFKAKLDEAGQPIEAGNGWAIDKPFDKGELALWPDQVLQTLSSKALELSKINETEEEAGND